jgi:hypothetical protein
MFGKKKNVATKATTIVPTQEYAQLCEELRHSDVPGHRLEAIYWLLYSEAYRPIDTSEAHRLIAINPNTPTEIIMMWPTDDIFENPALPLMLLEKPEVFLVCDNHHDRDNRLRLLKKPLSTGLFVGVLGTAPRPLCT